MVREIAQCNSERLEQDSIRPFPIYVNLDKKDWGPKTIWFFNSWLQHHNFNEIMALKWASYDNHGCGRVNIKEKLKLLKPDLNVWKSEVFDCLDTKIKKEKDEIHQLDIIYDAMGLEKEKVEKKS
ncbi:hypothetical protein ACS0TY_028779 [Phlomoides rotata]